MADHSELIAQFCAITGAVPYQAENYLEAHEYDLERAVDFYLEHPPQDHPPVEVDEEPAVGQEAQQSLVAPGTDEEFVVIPDEDEDGGLPELGRQRERALEARQQAHQQMEGHSFPAAAAAAGSRARSTRAPASGPGDLGPPDLMNTDHDDDDDGGDLLAAARAAAGLGVAGAGSSYHQQQQQHMLAHYQQLARQQQERQDFVDDPDAAAAIAIARAAEQAEAAAAGGANSAAGPAAVNGAAPDVPLDLPDGINLEEARMLEAAMWGVPYQGRMPDFNATAAAAEQLSPGVVERRSLQAEQDAAYEESLALDRAKQESIAAAQAAEDARQRAELEAEAKAARAEAEAQQQVAALLAKKQQRLPPEPDSWEAGSVSIVVRMSDGTRKGRRFRLTDPLQTVFDFVDVQCGQAAAVAGESESRVTPGSYRLVTQFPRKVYMEGSADSLQEAGISSDSALLLETL